MDIPGGCHTPDSTMSTGSVRSGFSHLSLTGSAGYGHYRLPEKLKIIKPLEGVYEVSLFKTSLSIIVCC